MECLQWVKMHPLASLELIADVASKRAKFFHRILRDDKVTHGADPETLNRLLQEGRERVAKAKGEHEQIGTGTLE